MTSIKAPKNTSTTLFYIYLYFGHTFSIYHFSVGVSSHFYSFLSLKALLLFANFQVIFFLFSVSFNEPWTANTAIEFVSVCVWVILLVSIKNNFNKSKVNDYHFNHNSRYHFFLFLSLNKRDQQQKEELFFFYTIWKIKIALHFGFWIFIWNS